MDKLSVVFFGTSDYCLPILESLNLNFNLRFIITRPDKPIGRKKILTPSATKTWALGHQIFVLTPATLKKDTPDRALILKQFSSETIDLAVVADYGLIIPSEIFNKPRLGTLNIHFSKLPDLRGPSPVQFTLLRGDTKAWITIFKLENPPELKIKMDSGPILHQNPFPIKLNDTTESLYSRLFQAASQSLPQVIRDYSHPSHLSLTPQDHSKATYTRFLTRNDGFIEWSLLNQALQGQTLQTAPVSPIKIQQEAIKTKQNISIFENSTDLGISKRQDNPISNLFDFYRAVTPWPGLWTIYPNGKRMKILKCHLEEKKIVLDLIQFEGEKPKTL